MRRDAVRLQIPWARDANVAGPLAPGVGLFPGVEEEQLEPLADAATDVSDDARVEEEPGREGVRKNEPDGTHAHLANRRSHCSAGTESTAAGRSSFPGKRPLSE